MFKVRYRYIFILGLAVYSFLNIRYTVGDKLFDFTISNTLLFITLTTVISGIWELNRLVEARLGTLYLFFKRKLHPLLILFVLSLLNVAAVCFIAMEALYALADIPVQINTAHLTLLMAFGFRVNLFLNCINAIVFYMNKLKKTQLEAEQLKKISIEAQFEALRNQINPHFLFNCFNVLSTLVYRDAETSAKFIDQLSSVYRYLLYNQEKKIVSLKEELAFIESYLYLLKIRFGENISIKNEIDREGEKFYVAPAVLQMLIENAIKHNVVSRKSPLEISLTAVNGSIIVSNTLQPKAVKEESTRIGLKNIQSRYEFLSNRKVEISKTENRFTVKIPLLELDE
ncbi:MAG: histidine kinase [Cyclobacteriaceae bacterium]|nr:histidine kinase [Cyclobacteriaceae bacterium]UYN86870.1 MAG: histidine kinase [Cyclobacteriaceae bacterium]